MIDETFMEQLSALLSDNDLALASRFKVVPAGQFAASAIKHVKDINYGYAVEKGDFIEPDNTPHYHEPAKPKSAGYLIGGFSAFQSPIDGETITNNKELAAHNTRHGVEQVGNDLKPKGVDGKTREESIKQQNGAK